MNFFFLPYNFLDRKIFLTVGLNNLNRQFCFLSWLSWEHSPFHWNEALYTLSSAYLNCQHHYACTLGPLLNTVRVTLTQALQYRYSQSDLVTKMATKWQVSRICWTKGWSMSLDDARFHHAAQDGTRFKSYELFTSGIFHLIFSDHGWPRVIETTECETTDKSYYCVTVIITTDTDIKSLCCSPKLIQCYTTITSHVSNF